MRKGLAIMTMLLICIIFYMASINRQPAVINKKQIIKELEKIQKEIDNEYPDDPIDVVAVHNKLMDMLYGQKIEDEQIEIVVSLQRKLYSDDLLTLTLEEDQLESVRSEILTNKEKKITLISSQISKSYYLDPNSIKVGVTHYTNGLDISREYRLQKESKWKIYGWEDVSSSKTQEEKK